MHCIQMTFENVTLILQTISPFAVLFMVYFLIKELKEQKKVAPANARQNIADSLQKVVLVGIKSILVKAKLRLRNNKKFTEEKNVAYLMKFIIMLRAREYQYYQFNKVMLDKDQWNSVAISFNTLFGEAKHLEIWEFIKITFAYTFVELVDAQVKQSKLSG